MLGKGLGDQMGKKKAVFPRRVISVICGPWKRPKPAGQRMLFMGEGGKNCIFLLEYAWVYEREERNELSAVGWECFPVSCG